MAVDEQHRQSFEEQLKKANESNPFMIHNHIRATVLSEKTSQVRAEIGADALNAMGGVHGGLMFVMAEIAAGLVTRNDGRRYGVHNFKCKGSLYGRTGGYAHD